MDEFWIKVIINVCIGLAVIIGFFVFWGRTSGVFSEGGFIYELLKKKKEEKRRNKKNGRDDS